MYLLKKRKELSERERNIQKLKEELRICDERIKSCQTVVEFVTEDRLIEAQIYQMLSLAKHREYLLSGIKSLMSEQVDEKSTR